MSASQALHHTSWRGNSSPDSSIRVLALVGPTAAGKSELAVEVAERIGAEIVSIDSAAVYRGMDIGTDKPSPALRARVRHHMVDIADPASTFSVAEFQRMARATIQDIASRGVVPLLVGGSGLYFRAVVDPLEFPGTDPVVRTSIQSDADEVGPRSLHERLAALDPEAAAKIPVQNVRRVVRALEVIEVTGRRFSSFRTGWDEYRSIYDLHVAGITFDLDEMDRRIEARFDEHLADGLLEEMCTLDDLGLRESMTSVQALGYAQLLAHLDGRMSLEQAVTEAKARIRRFARRQLTWFRADPRVVWFGSDPVGAKEWLISKKG